MQTLKNTSEQARQLQNTTSNNYKIKQMKAESKHNTKQTTRQLLIVRTPLQNHLALCWSGVLNNLEAALRRLVLPYIYVGRRLHKKKQVHFRVSSILSLSIVIHLNILVLFLLLWSNYGW